ncbi:FUSC family protein [Burkholderia ubonensis]|uniref:FUSC family protein n=1 Tax=Burkholderia ubonensis TaxID=101571 RepID=UPI000758C563|nr:FUSC family protein [Burkholderia ubonensis]AOI73708.1 fusaric acid resistance protein [Burkholderia ubonensis]KUZ22370.1 fusaric acid resistance protein [Burkholderia ubonensis]KUZ28147.1 fusaric acid resistance protein [Burkholderia ubonensis]KUZ39548.1 fusaric acid resistance protein [Burkholderia ubonensis]KUZ49292.1 fusaric acid resistance protein [Burkholderia ubonensis]
MAQPAADVRPPGPRELLRLLAPFPGRASMAVRVALICTLTVLVTSAYGTPEAAISAYVVFFLNRADRVTSVVLATAMMLVITVVIALVLGVAIFSIEYSVLRVACMAVLSVGLLYLTSASKLRPVGAILAMIVGFGLDELGLVPGGEAATRALLYTWLMVAIPVGIAIVVNLLIAPSPRRLALAQLAKRLRLAAQRLRGEDDGRDTDDDDVRDDVRAAFDASLREGDKQLLTWLKLSKLEGTSSAADVAALRQAVASSTAILVAVALADREPGARLPDAFAAPVAATLDQMAGMLEQGGYPVDVTLALPPADALAPLARVVATDLHAAITRFTEPGATAAAPPVDANAPAAGSAAEPAAPPPAPRGGFFLPDAHTNPDHIRYALKTTVAAMFCYLLYSQLDWSGIHTCFITCYMVSLGSTAETVEKLTLRIAGCIVGALAGTAALVYVVPALSSIGHLMALVFAGAGLAAWVAFGSPRIAYAGFQIAFAFFLCVIQGAGPGFDLTLARDRTIGILLGNVVVYLVFTRIWPVSIGKQVDAALAALVDQWRRLAQIAQPAERRAQAAEAFARHGAIAQDLGLIHYEPSWVRPAPAWLAMRRRALAELGALEGPLFLLAERAPGDSAIGAQLARVAELRDAEPGTGAERHAPAAARTTDDARPPAQDARPDAPPSSRPSGDRADPARDALLNLIDARLARIADAARQATSKELHPHAPT